MCITKCWFFYFNLVQFWKRSVALFFTILNMNVLFINVKYRKAQTNWPCITWHSLRPFFAVLVCCRVFEDLFRCEQITWFIRWRRPWHCGHTKLTCQVTHTAYFMLFNRYTWAIGWRTPCRNQERVKICLVFFLIFLRKVNQVAQMYRCGQCDFKAIQSQSAFHFFFCYLLESPY